MYFIDEIEIYVKAGNGGNGCVSFLREKYRPFGGPAGGNGGKGANIIIKASYKYNTLSHLRNKHKIIAPNGGNGKGKNCNGKDAKDLTIEVPVGVVIKDKNTGLILKELTKENEAIVIVNGGKGGRGNSAFKSSKNQIPNIAEKGEKGEERYLLLELKLLADVGLVGLPNAGKSTLLSSLSNAKPKIANYPFTTKAPNLGVVRISNYKQIVIADLPGIIEGASEGKGLGTKFLKHLEKTRFIIYVIDISKYASLPPLQAFLMLQNEIERFNPRLLTLPSCVAANKIDLEGSNEVFNDFRKKSNTKMSILPISALKGTGITRLIKLLSKYF